MFRKLFRKFNYLRLKSQSNESSRGKEEIPKSVDKIKERLNHIFSECDDFVIREVVMGEKNEKRIIIAFIDGLIRKEIIDTDVLKPILTESKLTNLDKELDKHTAIDTLKKYILSLSSVKEILDLWETVDFILSGDAIIYVDGSRKALQVDTKAFEARGVEEPNTERVVRGPREGFTEVLKVNTSLIRRKIKNPNLKFEIMKLGKQTNTDVCICYIKGIVDNDIVETVKRRLKKINTDAILESGYIEEFIEDAPLSMFPTIGNTEKPDIVAAKILEGRVAILCDGTPFVLTVPYLFIESIQASEDYYARSFFSTFIRLIRVLAMFITAVVPALYVALISFHHDIIPTDLVLRIAASREGIPFSAFLEALIMVITFELLRESGVRMPKPIGQAVSIVGALVLGQAAVEAGLISNIMVIIIAITAISGFIVTPMAGTMTFIRLILLVAGNTLGLMGIGLAGTALYIHMCSLRSFGMPYMAPFSPLTGSDLKDALVRVPVWAMLARPKSLRKADKPSYRMNVDYRTKED